MPRRLLFGAAIVALSFGQAYPFFGFGERLEQRDEPHRRTRKRTLRDRPHSRALAGKSMLDALVRSSTRAIPCFADAAQ